MKIKSIVMFSLAAIATSLTAMPTKQDLKQVEGLVQELMRPELDAFKTGKKTRADVAKSAIALAEKAESDAAKMLLLKGSFTFYVGHGAFDEAIGVLKTLKTTIPDIPPEYMANMIESALRNVPKNKGGLIYRLLDDTKSYVRHQEELKDALAKSRKQPSDKTLHLKIAELYVSLGDWDKALDEFAKGDNPKAAEAAKAEKGEGKMPKSAIADFWWSYPGNDEEEQQQKFKRHAAAIYAEAINSGDASGLVKVKAQRHIDEVKGYGEDMLAGVITSPASGVAGNSHPSAGNLYCVVDLSAGPNATKYPVSYLDAEPKGGWTDEYKTTKLVLRRIEPGKFMMLGKYEVTLTKPFYCGVFEVTQKQYELVTGGNPSKFKGDMRPVEMVPWNVFRGNSATYNWPSSVNVDPSTFIGKIQVRTGLNFDLPTEAQWEYACRAGTTSKFNNGCDSESDLKKLGRFMLNQKERSFNDDNESFAKHEPDGKGGYSGGHTVVGSYMPNAWGLYDMHGNVWEWCLDWRDRRDKGLILSSGVTDPVGPSSGAFRVMRGGCWDSRAAACTSFTRNHANPVWVRHVVGFRLALHLHSQNGINRPQKKEQTLPAEKLQVAPVAKTKTSALYCVVDLSAGPNATKYPVSYLDAEPKGGWTDEYKTTKLVLRRIEPGTFIMGEDQKDEFHRVTLTKPYYIGVFEVTQCQYKLVTGNNPTPRNWAGGTNASMCPVTGVIYSNVRGDPYKKYNWPEVKTVAPETFIGRIRTRTGNNGFDLPTEAQWEYACRAGTTSKFNNGSDDDEAMFELGRFILNQSMRDRGESDEDFAKHRPDGEDHSAFTIVGSYKPNAWGLYDMHGNVWEWTLNWPGAMRGENPTGPSKGDRKVCRGGRWSSRARDCTSSSRGQIWPDMMNKFIAPRHGGFRLALWLD